MQTNLWFTLGSNHHELAQMTLTILQLNVVEELDGCRYSHGAVEERFKEGAFAPCLHL